MIKKILTKLNNLSKKLLKITLLSKKFQLRKSLNNNKMLQKYNKIKINNYLYKKLKVKLIQINFNNNNTKLVNFNNTLLNNNKIYKLQATQIILLYHKKPIKICFQIIKMAIV